MTADFYDDFARADSDDLGPDWTELAPDKFSISGNKLVTTSGTDYRYGCYAKEDASFRNGYAQIEFEMLNGVYLRAVHIRYDPTGNTKSYTAYWYNGQFILGYNWGYSYAATLSSTTGVSIPDGTNVRIKIEAVDDYIEATIYNADTETLLHTLSKTDSNLTGVGNVAISAHGASVSFNNFFAHPVTIPSLVFANPFHNGSVLLANRTDIKAHIYEASTGLLKATRTGLVTDAAGLLPDIVDTSEELLGDADYWVKVEFSPHEICLVRNLTSVGEL